MQRVYVVQCTQEYDGVSMTDDTLVQVAVKTTNPRAQQSFVDGLQAWFTGTARPAALAAALAHAKSPDMLTRMGLDPVMWTGPRMRFGSLQCCQVSWYRGSDKATVTIRETNAQLHCLFAVDFDDITVFTLITAKVQEYIHGWLVTFVHHVFKDDAGEGKDDTGDASDACDVCDAIEIRPATAAGPAGGRAGGPPAGAGCGL
jgi:hypothetical protein